MIEHNQDSLDNQLRQDEFYARAYKAPQQEQERSFEPEEHPVKMILGTSAVGIGSMYVGYDFSTQGAYVLSGVAVVVGTFCMLAALGGVIDYLEHRRSEQ